MFQVNVAENALPAVGAPGTMAGKKNLEMKDKMCFHFNTLPKTKM